MPSAKRSQTRFSFGTGLVSVDDPIKASSSSFSAGRNVRLEELSSLLPRLGSTIKSAHPAGAPTFTARYIDSNKNTPIVSNGTQVYALEAAGWTLVGTFPVAGSFFRGWMARGRLYATNGDARPHRLRWTGTAWEFREVGLAAPSAATSTGGGGGGGAGGGGAGGTGGTITDLADTDPAMAFLAVAHNFGPNGSVMGSSSAGTTFRRYRLDTNAWSDMPARPEAMTGSQILQGLPDGRIVYAPHARIYPGDGSGNTITPNQRNTYFFTPAGETGTWGVALSTIGNAALAWTAGCSISGPSSGQAIAALIYQSGGSPYGYGFHLLVESGASLNTTQSQFLPDVFGPGEGTGETHLHLVQASSMVNISVSLSFAVYQRPGEAGFRTSHWDTAVNAHTTNGVNAAGNLTGPFVLARGDRLVYAGAGNTVFLYRDATAQIYSYDLPTRVWTLIAGLTEVHHSGMVGGQPATQVVYYNTAAGGTDFRNEGIPGTAAPPPPPGGGGGGSGNTYVVALSFVDNLGHESSIGPTTTITGVSTGASIPLTIPVGTSPIVVARRIYSTLANDPNGPLFLVVEIANNTATTTSISSFDTARDQTTEAPTDNDQPEIGFRYGTFWNNRIIFGNRPGFTSRVSYSKTDSADAYPRALIDDVDPDDGGQVRGFFRAAFLGIPKSSTTYVLAGDPEEVDPVLRLFEYGCEDENSIVEVDGGGIFLSEKGLVFFNGFDAQRIDKAVANFVAEYRAAPVTSSIAFRQFYRWSYQDPADATRSKVLVFDSHNKAWLLDSYPSNLRGWFFNQEAVTIGAVSLPEGVYAVDSTSLWAMDIGTTDNASAIGANATVKAFSSSGAVREANWDSVLVDLFSTVAQAVTITTDVDEGSAAVSYSESFSGTGREDRFSRLPLDHAGRVLRVNVSIPTGSRLNGIVIGSRERQRRPT